MESLTKIMSPEDFVKNYYPFAVASQKLTRIPALFTMAQGAAESAWGNKVTGAFNLFGIKADSSWKGATEVKVTHECMNGKWSVINASFRSYTDATAAFTDHAQFFITNHRYANALTVENDSNAFADFIAKDGYATDPNYAATLKALIHSVQIRLPTA